MLTLHLVLGKTVLQVMDAYDDYYAACSGSAFSGSLIFAAAA